jgi:hypothetical protein
MRWERLRRSRPYVSPHVGQGSSTPAERLQVAVKLARLKAEAEARRREREGGR